MTGPTIETNSAPASDASRAGPARHRRRLLVAGVALIVAVGAAVAVFWPRHSPPDANGSLAPELPGCVSTPFTMAALGTVEGAHTLLVSTTANAPITLRAVLGGGVESAPDLATKTAHLIVGKPMTEPGAGEPDQMPADSMVRPENQVAVSPGSGAHLRLGATISVSLSIATAGDYPVMYLISFRQPSACAFSGPSEEAAEIGFIRIA